MTWMYFELLGFSYLPLLGMVIDVYSNWLIGGNANLNSEIPIFELLKQLTVPKKTKMLFMFYLRNIQMKHEHLLWYKLCTCLVITIIKCRDKVRDVKKNISTLWVYSSKSFVERFSTSLCLIS